MVLAFFLPVLAPSPRKKSASGNPSIKNSPFRSSWAKTQGYYLVERIDERVASHAVMMLLSAFFEDLVQRTFKRLTHLLAMKGAGGGLDKVG
jgi:hypothetical protein